MKGSTFSILHHSLLFPLPTMASKLSMYLLFLIPIFLIISTSSADEEKQMVFYMQETTGGPNATVVTVAGVNGSSSAFGKGTIMVVDDAVTAGIERSSMALGRAQGLFVGITSAAFYLETSVVFENGTYNGSSLQVQGSGNSFLAVREYSIVGGTGLFGYARGFVNASTVASAGFDITVKYNVSLRVD